MKTLKYTIIKSVRQYNEYCEILEELLNTDESNKAVKDETELLTLLIGKWDDEHTTFNDTDPVTLLRSLMQDRCMKSKDLVTVLGVTKGLVSDILNYKKGLSKEIIRALAAEFRVSQEAFNRPYNLKIQAKGHLNRGHLIHSNV